MKTTAIALGIGLIALIVRPAVLGQIPVNEATAIRQRVEAYVDAYNRQDAAAVAALWSEDGVYVSQDTGERIVGREAIAEMFQGLFQGAESSTLTVAIDAIRLVTNDVAIEDGTAEIVFAPGDVEKIAYTAVHVKRDGQWFLDSVRETITPAPVVDDEPTA